MLLLPDVWRHSRIVRIASQHPIQNVFQIFPNIKAMAFGTTNYAHQPCHALPRFNVGYEEPIFPAQCNLTHQLLDAVKIEELLPDRWKAAHPEAVRQYREQERRDKADTAVVQAARRRMRAELRKDQ